MRPSDSGARRCPRCAGSGDIPIIAPDCFVHPEAHPLLQGCPDCNATGWAVEEPPPKMEEPKAARKARR